MPTLIAVVTADERTTTEQLAAMMRSALKPGHHVYGDADGDIYQGGLTLTALEIRHPDGEHYRDKATGQFASPADEAERPGEIEHETGDVRRPPAPRGAVAVTGDGTPPVDLGDDPDGDVAGYDGAGAQ